MSGSQIARKAASGRAVAKREAADAGGEAIDGQVLGLDEGGGAGGGGDVDLLDALAPEAVFKVEEREAERGLFTQRRRKNPGRRWH